MIRTQYRNVFSQAISLARLACTFAAMLAFVAPPVLLAQRSGAGEDPRFAPIRRAFGQGKAEEGYFRIELPRTDLHVSIGGDALAPDFEFRSYVGFVPVGARDVLAMGEIVLRQEEVPAVIATALRQGIEVTAVHNHLLDETPRIIFVHVMAQGSPAKLAEAFHAAFAASATPLSPPSEEQARGDWGAIDAVLGRHEEAEGTVAEYEFPRRGPLHVHGVRVRSSGVIETASEAVFQQLPGGRVASTGELYLLPAEVERVVRTLEEHGLHVTALHTHMLDDGPAHYWVHWYAAGDAAALARGVAAAVTEAGGAIHGKERAGSATR